MAMNVGPAEGDEEDEVVSAINTTPLVDVMLVLLIIFLITIPVVTHTIKVTLPDDRNQPTQTKPQNVIIAVTTAGQVYWNSGPVADNADLLKRLETVSQIKPQPEVHIRGDQNAQYESIGRVVTDCQQAGIFKIAFITQPAPHGG